MVLEIIDRQPLDAFVRGICPFESVLERDPAGAYRGMDAATKHSYRRAAESLAMTCRVSPTQLLRRTLALAARGGGRTPAGDLRGDLGFYLVGPGRDSLLPCDVRRRRDSARLKALCLPLIGLTAFITFAASRAWGVDTDSSILDLIVVLAFTALAFEAAWKMLEAAFVLRRPARVLPAMSFDRVIPDDAATLVCVPALLTSTSQVEELVGRLEAHWRVEPDRNVRFALLTDWLDSDREEPTDEETTLLDRCAELVAKLNRGTAVRSIEPFYLLHRARVWSAVQRRWMGQGRKAGKLQALNRFLVDGSTEFARVTGNIDALSSIRYVVVLDEDTGASPGAIRRLAGAIHHPLNRASRSDDLAQVRRGYGIVVSPVLARPDSLRAWRRPRLFLHAQPVATEGAARAPLRNGFFDLFGQRMFAGKGIYDVRLARELLDDRFPLDRMLSHDVMEGGILRTAFFDRATLLDDFPATYRDYCARIHRWLRGDWQNVGLLVRGRVPPFLAFLVLNNARVSLLVVAYVVAVVLSIALDPALASRRLAATVALPLTASYLVLATGILRSLARAPMIHEIRGWWAAVRAMHSHEFVRLLTAPHQALLALDAMATACFRMISGRNLLEWNPASLASRGARRSKLTAYLHAVPLASVILAACLVAGDRMAPAAVAVLGLWVVAPYAIRKLVG